jgi:Asp-tRNA(Asn)/Glu-tRNA(Gln) amidotransferase A subunit family amidase
MIETRARLTIPDVADSSIAPDAKTIAQQVSSGAYSPKAVIQAFPARIEALNPVLNAIVDCEPSKAKDRRNR